MEKLKVTPGLIVKPSSIHGYGVFAGKPFARGDLIEECATINIKDPPLKEHLASGKHHLCNYIHRLNDDLHILLGNGSLYNHANKPNAELVYNPKRRLMQIWAIDAIPRGREIVMYYGDNWIESNMNRIVKSKQAQTFSQALLELPLAKTFVVVAVMLVFLKVIIVAF